MLLWFSKKHFLCIQCPKISFFLFKDGADLRMESFSLKQSLHTLSLGANGFTFLSTSNLMLKYIYREVINNSIKRKSVQRCEASV